jgi:pyruvate/2-oxoglutarate dehydrogenase complex dihydrolipoamide acyltransferase (E2) component
MAAKEGIDIRSVTGSGDGGRVVKRDIENMSLPLVSVNPLNSKRRLLQHLSMARFLFLK